MKVGDCVYAKRNPDYDDEYVIEAKEARRLHDERVGRIVEYHDSHGYCFDVAFTDGQKACFDPDELTVITQHQWTDHVRSKIVKVTDGASVKKNTRSAEVLINGYWQNSPFQRIGRGDVFRLFEEDGSDVDHGQVCVAEEPARANKDGVYGVKCKPLGREEKPIDAKEGMIIWIDGEPLRFSNGGWDGAGLDRKEDTP